MRRSTHLLLIGFLCTVYLALEVSYVVRLPLVMDEFGTARSIWEVGEKLPYRDYAPPKTVLGYYLLAPLLRSVDPVWQSLIAVKVQIAACFALALFIVFGWWPQQEQRTREASVLALLILVTMSTFLERSAELRVDPLMGICALLATWAVARQRVAVAGLIAGLALLVTQKSAYLVVAAGFGACATVWMRAGWRAAVRAGLRYSAAVAGVLVAYIGLWWVWTGDLMAVLRPTFLDENIVKIATGDLYPGIRRQFWGQTFRRNPLFWMLSLVAIAERLARARSAPRADVAAAATAAALLLFSAIHKQPWPYFFVLVIPVLAAAQIGFLRAWLGLSARRARAALALLVVAAVAWPLHRVPIVLSRDQSYQRETVELADAILEPGESYLDGVGMAFRHEQEIEWLRWLDATRLSETQNLAAADRRALVAAVRQRSGKLLIMSYRIAALPPPVQALLGRRFAPLAGAVFIYAPVIDGDHAEIEYAGVYTLPPGAAPLRIDGRLVAPGETILLSRGSHAIEGGASRLVLIPRVPLPTAENRPLRPLFENVYDY